MSGLDNYFPARIVAWKGAVKHEKTQPGQLQHE